MANAANTQSAHPAWKMKLPMAFTLARIAFCPFIVLVQGFEGDIWGWVAAALFIVASITDWLDGHYARKYGAITNMGKFMDPIADKILVASALIMLIPPGRVGPILVLLLLVRDILIGGIRSVAAADNVIIDAKAAGKWKTGLQMVAIPAILIRSSVFDLPIYQAALALLWVSVVLSLISGVQYVMLYAQGRRKTN